MVSNAFVRTFAELVERGALKVNQWKSYIEQFAGGSDYDWNPVYQTLSADFGIDRLPKRDLASAAFEAQVMAHLVHQAQSKLTQDPYAEDKARRDATLYVAVLDHLTKLKEHDPASACIVVSSAKRLQEVEQEFKRTGEPQLVVSVGAALYMIALLPDVQLGLTAMKSFLFDEQRYRFSSDLERNLLRLVRGTAQVALPQAKRGVLMRVLRQKLVKDASERGERPTEQSVRRLEREAMIGANEKRTMTLLSEALEEVGLGTREKGEVQQLRKRIAELESQLERGRQKN